MVEPSNLMRLYYLIQQKITQPYPSNNDPGPSLQDLPVEACVHLAVALVKLRSHGSDTLTQGPAVGGDPGTPKRWRGGAVLGEAADGCSG